MTNYNLFTINICRLSFFGKNIKKIRTVKKLSQTAFADLFNLKRGSIGAYEEGRAEAKIDTVINIAEYFKLSLDQLLTSELTINEIYHIDLINRKLYHSKLGQKHNRIPFVSAADKDEFIQNYNNNDFLDKLPEINIPHLGQNNIAFESFDSSMLGMSSGIKQGDILITQLIKFEEINNLPKQSIVLVLYENNLVIGVPVLKNKELILSPVNTNFRTHYIDIENIKKVWKITNIITNSFFSEETLGNRIQNIENELNAYKKEIFNLKSKI